MKRHDDLSDLPLEKPCKETRDLSELHQQLEAARLVMEKYKETLQRLADS
jgi:hypothetical protein